MCVVESTPTGSATSTDVSSGDIARGDLDVARSSTQPYVWGAVSLIDNGFVSGGIVHGMSLAIDPILVVKQHYGPLTP